MKQFSIGIMTLLLHISLWSQGTEKIYESPSSNFIDLSLQTIMANCVLGCKMSTI